MLGDRTNVADQSRLAAFYVLQKALGVPADLLVLPVTYSESVLYLEYENPVSPQLAEAFHVPDTALSSDRRRMFGQNYVDQLPQPAARVTVGVPADLLVLPVTYSESVLYLEYENPVSPQLAEAFHIPDT